jgi:predicted nucleotidyltransferase component of viral defense system
MGSNMSMIHTDKGKFYKIVDRIATQTGFYAPLMEKDYYLTLILSQINKLSENLFLKGGTCLNKIYYSYYRLSEDLDFNMCLPDNTADRGIRQKCIQPIKNNIESFAKQFGMRIENIDNAGRNASKQYIYSFIYDSVTLPTEQTVKIEIGLRFNPVDKTETHNVQHKFLNTFTGEPLFDGGKVNCLSLNEIVSEKLRAAALRLIIASRDFYDLDFILRNNFDLANKKVIGLFKKKIEEDGADTNLTKYRVNLGRSNTEIKDMRSRIQAEMMGVLTEKERHNFDLDKALERINNAMKNAE